MTDPKNETECQKRIATGELLRQYAAGQVRSEPLRIKGSHVLRIWPEGCGSMILKFWHRPALHHKVNKAFRRDPLSREVRTLEYFDRQGVPVPGIIAYLRNTFEEVPCSGALFLEDLGECQTVLEYVKALQHSGAEAELREVEDEIIELTRKLIHARITDIDHTLTNMVVTQAGKLYRLDYELARKTLFPNWAVRQYSLMLSRLLASYTYAVQPAPERVVDFAGRLRDGLQPPAAVLGETTRRYEGLMQLQYERIGIETKISLPW